MIYFNFSTVIYPSGRGSYTSTRSVLNTYRMRPLNYVTVSLRNGAPTQMPQSVYHLHIGRWYHACDFAAPETPKLLQYLRAGNTDAGISSAVL
jgi:hypothetical protein